MTKISSRYPIYSLKARHKNQISRLQNSKMDDPISIAVAQRLCRLACDLKKRVGVLIDHRGSIARVLIGDHQSILIPHLDGKPHLNNYHFLHTHLRKKDRKNILNEEDLYDLVLLQLDATTGITYDKNGAPQEIQTAFLAHNEKQGYVIENRQYLRNHSANGFLQNIDEHKRANRQKKRLWQQQGNGKRALLVGVYTDAILERRISSIEESLDELKLLCKSAGFEVIGSISQKRSQLDPYYLLGRGKAKQMAWQAVTSGADLIVFDLEISAAQAKRIAKISELKVLDRTQIILDIFSQRAISEDGKIQVELAQLRYRKSRLAETDDHYSRLVGGIGSRGPGETSMEIGQRRIQQKIHRLEKKLQQIRKRRYLNRKRRQKNLPAVAIIGYTNAGKSTLLNALTLSSVKTDDAVFVTLDPKSRRLRFPNECEVILIDTVGFTREIPLVLSGAFAAIFEEMKSADLLLHLIDFSDPQYEKKIKTIDNIMHKLGCGHIPYLRIFNKIDQKYPPQTPHSSEDHVCISAKKRIGLENLLKKIESRLLHIQFQ